MRCRKRAVLLGLAAPIGVSLFHPASAQSQAPVFLDQGTKWAQKRLWFYSATQGSELMDYKWFTSLKRADSNELFISDSLARFGYLPNPKNPYNPQGLPVGFTVNVRDGRQSIGMTCAGCHTSQIEYGGTTYQIDGAPGGGDLYGFVSELNDALQATAKPGDKFEDFADAVLGQASSRARRAALMVSLKQFADRFMPYATRSLPEPAKRWGPARADAFGMIFNRVAGYDLPETSNFQAAKAPVSYPFLWGIPWHDKVQWNGSAPNTNVVFRLARNTGEVLGVFASADLNLKKPFLLPPYYETSINRRNLIKIEESLLLLKRPKWPAAFGKIDPALAATGKTYYKQYCADCHTPFNPDNPQQIKVFMDNVSNLKTDPTMAQAALAATVKTNQMQGTKNFILFGNELKARDSAFSVVGTAVVGSILRPGKSTAPFPSGSPLNNRQALSESLSLTDIPKESRTDTQDKALQDLIFGLNDYAKQVKSAHEEQEGTLFYKARPLDGIWATAPYLHNGSVPTLEDLFKPSKDRPTGFYVGIKYDPVKVGLNTQAQTNFYLNTNEEGNYNTGHEGRWKDKNGKWFIYGTDIPDNQKKAILEYLKTL